MRHFIPLLLVPWTIGCSATKNAASDTPAVQQETPERGPWTTPPPTVLPAPTRLVGFADVHGDLAATRNVLKMAELIDDNDNWVGGETVVVQTGDQLDITSGRRSLWRIHHLEEPGNASRPARFNIGILVTHQ